MDIRYAEFAPGRGLAESVRCYWAIHGGPSADDDATPPPSNRVLPDNCIDVIFDLRPDAAQAFVVGPMLSAAVIEQVGSVDMLGIRFCPGAATEFIDARAADLVAAHVDARDVWPNAGSLTVQLMESTRAERPTLLESWLLSRRKARREATLARIAAAAIERAKGTVPAGTLADALGVSERKLQRAFMAAVGITPKEALRVERFRVAASMLRSTTLARVAAICGYADQAHLTREFVALSGLTPAAFRDERRLVGFVQD